MGYDAGRRTVRILTHLSKVANIAAHLAPLVARINRGLADRRRIRVKINVMIPLSQETLIPLRELPKHLPPRANGKRVHISACYRWVSVGVRGVVLESLKIGGTTYTSIEAIERFAAALSRRPMSRELQEGDRRSSVRTRSWRAATVRLEQELALPLGRLTGVPVAGGHSRNHHAPKERT